MFKLPALPSPKAELHELADFAELLAWSKGSASAREIVAYLGRQDDNDHNIGCDDNDDENADELDEVMNEVERRKAACGEGYPFELEFNGTVLRYIPVDDNHRSDVYRYLLLSTRLNMQSQRTHADIDGTGLLEEIAARVLQCYLGPARARSVVFGTASKGKFEDKVNYLCREIGEGGCFSNIDAVPVQANDDKLDTVTWIPFVDKKPGQLVVFGQCKTGTNWRDQITQLQPNAFLRRWTSSRSYLVDPLRALCVSEAADRSRWNGTVVYSGLFLDRCRIVDFCESLDPDLLSRVKVWNTAAYATVEIG